MRYLTLILLIIFSITASAGLPPTSTKGSGDSNPVTTFRIDTPNIPITHSGTTATLGTVSVAGGGTGLTTYTAPCTLLANTNNTISCLAATTSNRVLLTTNGTTLSMGQVDLSTAQVTGTLPNSNTGATVAATNSTIVLRDSGAQIRGSAYVTTPATIVTGGGTATLTATSAGYEICTGTNTHTVKLPVVTTLAAGHEYRILNNSTLAVTVVSSGSNTIRVLSAGTSAIFHLISNSADTTAAPWGVIGYGPVAAGTASAVATYDANGALTSTAALGISNGGTNSTATATAGGIGYGTGTAHAYTAAGTAGNVVLSGGAGTPTYATSTGWYIDAYMLTTSGQFDLGASAQASFVEITNANGSMNPVSGSAAVGTVCATTNAATTPSTSQTTCAAGNEGVGFYANFPVTGRYMVCIDAPHRVILDQAVEASITTKWVVTGSNNQTVASSGVSRNYLGGRALSTGGSNDYRRGNLHLCDMFQVTAGLTAFRVFYMQTVNGTPQNNYIEADNTNGNVIHYSVWPLFPF